MNRPGFHNWIETNIGGERVAMCESCGKTFDEADQQEYPADCYGCDWEDEYA